MRHPLCRILKRTRGQVSVPLLFGDLLSHDAKIAGNNLAWKDIEFYARCGWRIKKEGEEWRECRREIVNLGSRIQMKEMRTLNTLLEKFKNPTKADYETIAIA